jgi:hypothetical protein
MVPRRLLFRNPEFGHELGTKPVEGTAGSGGFGAVAGSAGWSSLHATSMIVTAAPATRSRTTPMANVMGDSINANKPKTRSQTGMMDRWLNSIDMAITLLLEF